MSIHTEQNLDVVKLIEENELAQAIERLRKLKDGCNATTHELSIQHRRLIANNANLRRGLITTEEFSTGQNKITLALLEILSTSNQTEAVEEPADLADQFYEFGNIHAQEENYHRAILYFSKAISAAPRHANAYLERGAAKFAIGSLEEAEQDLTTAIGLSPNQPFALLNRGIVYYCLRQPEKARADWKLVRDLGFDIADQYLENICAEN